MSFLIAELEKKVTILIFALSPFLRWNPMNLLCDMDFLAFQNRRQAGANWKGIPRIVTSTSDPRFYVEVYCKQVKILS